MIYAKNILCKKIYDKFSLSKIFNCSLDIKIYKNCKKSLKSSKNDLNCLNNGSKSKKYFKTQNNN